MQYCGVGCYLLAIAPGLRAVPVRENSRMMTGKLTDLCVSSLPSIALRDAVCCPEAVPSTQIIDAAARPEIGWIEEEEGRANHGCKRVRCRLYRKPSGTHCHDVDGGVYFSVYSLEESGCGFRRHWRSSYSSTFAHRYVALS